MVTNNIDIVIKSMFQSTGVKQAVSSIEDMANKLEAIVRMSTMLAGTGLGFNPKTNRFFELATGKMVGIEQAASAVANKQENVTKAVRQYTTRAKVATKQTESFRQKLAKIKGTFSMQFLGVMFFGMAIKQAMESIAKSTISSFMKISEGSTAAGQGINALSATFELLKFTIGEAIATLISEYLPVILPIIDRIADWIEQNKELAAWIILGGIAIGTMLFFIGQLALGLQALKNMIWLAIVGLVRFAAIILSVVMSALTWLVTGGIAIVAVFFAVFIVLVTAFVWAWKNNWNNIIEFTKETFGILWDLIKLVAGGVWDIFKTMLDMVTAAFKGDWKRVWELTKKLGNQLFVLLAKMAVSIVAIIQNMGKFINRILVDIAVKILQLLADLNGEIEKIFVRLKVAVQNAFIGMVNVIKEQLNKLIDIFADIEILGKKPFAWLKTLKTQMTPLVNLTDELNKVDTATQETKTGIEKLGDAFKTKFLSPTTREDVQKMHDFIDANNQYAKQLEDMKYNNEDPYGVATDESFMDKIKDIGQAIKETTTMIMDDLGVTEKLNGIMEEVQGTIAGYVSSIKETFEATTQATQQNYEHANSIASVNTQLRESIDLYQQINEVRNTGGGAQNIDLSDFGGNYAFQDK